MSFFRKCRFVSFLCLLLSVCFLSYILYWMKWTSFHVTYDRESSSLKSKNTVQDKRKSLIKPDKIFYDNKNNCEGCDDLAKIRREENEKRKESHTSENIEFLPVSNSSFDQQSEAKLILSEEILTMKLIATKSSYTSTKKGTFSASDISEIAKESATSKQHIHQFSHEVIRKRNERNLSYILLWRYPWGKNSEGPREGIKFGNCVTTYNRTRIKDAEAVLFHFSALDRETMPWKHYRDRHQIFVYYNHESPAYLREDEKRQNFYKFDNNFINVTMTYRSDSSVPSVPYGMNGYLPNAILENKGKQWVEEKLSKKKKLALFVVSNCNVTHGAVERLKYAEKLVKAGLSLDRFGKCFNNGHIFNKLPIEKVQAYKFYLAFENAIHCKDYLSEKLWRNSYSNGRVPIVWGPTKADVTRLAPNNSFIHVEDFDSPASLVSYLQYLDKNDTAYREYFNWIENPDSTILHMVKMHKKHWLEALCDFLSSKERKHYSVDSVTDFYRNETNLCFYARHKTQVNENFL